MIEVRLPIDDELSRKLEDYFCEDIQEHWLLEENWKTREQFLRGFFTAREEVDPALAALRATFPELSGEAVLSELADQDWKEAYKLHFKPWSERGLHWVPIWERESYVLPEGDEVVYLDPGMAFGTGNHETTRLCVRRLLDARDEWGGAVPQKHVIDAGCGSGILAISARKLGFTNIFGFDNDPDSVRISLDNEKLCGLEGAIDFKWADLREGLQDTHGDLLLVNILAHVLCEHAGLLCESVRPGGWLILSGILAREVTEVHAVFAPQFKTVTGVDPEMDSRVEGDWADLCYRF